MEWLDVIYRLAVSGGVIYLLVDRFARTKEQRGTDAANMVQQVAIAFEKTLNTVMTYTQGVIENMKKDSEHNEARHQQTEKRCSELEQKISDVAADNDQLNSIINEAVGCKHLKSGNNKDCPVLSRNAKRLNARCRAMCKTEKENN